MFVTECVLILYLFKRLYITAVAVIIIIIIIVISMYLFEYSQILFFNITIILQYLFIHWNKYYTSLLLQPYVFVLIKIQQNLNGSREK